VLLWLRWLAAAAVAAAAVIARGCKLPDVVAVQQQAFELRVYGKAGQLSQRIVLQTKITVVHSQVIRTGCRVGCVRCSRKYTGPCLDAT
jgi:hypothetical protein